MSLHGDPTFALDPDDPKMAVCIRCGARMSSDRYVNFRDYHRDTDCPKRPGAGAKYSHPSFPEIELREGETILVRDPKNPGVYPLVSVPEVLQHLSNMINNEVANSLYNRPGLYLFFRRLARDIGEMATLYTSPDRCSPATVANLEHFRRRVDGDDTGW